MFYVYGGNIIKCDIFFHNRWPSITRRHETITYIVYVILIHPKQNLSINMHLKYDYFDLINIVISLVQVI